MKSELLPKYLTEENPPPEWKLPVRGAVFYPEMLNKALAFCAICFTGELEPPLEIICRRFEAWKAVDFEMAEGANRRFCLLWNMVREVVDKLGAHRNLDAFNRVKDEHSQTAIKRVAPPNAFERCPRSERIILLTVWKKVSAQPIIIHNRES